MTTKEQAARKATATGLQKGKPEKKRSRSLIKEQFVEKTGDALTGALIERVLEFADRAREVEKALLSFLDERYGIKADTKKRASLVERKRKLEANPQVKQFIDWWFERFKAERGLPYNVLPRDPMLVKRMLGTYSYDELLALAESFFTIQDDFIQNQGGYQIGIFYVTLNKVASVAPVTTNGHAQSSALEQMKKLQEQFRQA